MTLFLALGLIGVVSISTLFASGQLPGLGGFDAAQTQYEDDDDDGKKDKKDKKDKDDDDGAAPGGGVLSARSCNRAPFRTERGFAACNREVVLVASGLRTLEQACAGFPETLGRQAACRTTAGPPPGTLP
jgi:hypothetical protein